MQRLASVLSCFATLGIGRLSIDASMLMAMYYYVDAPSTNKIEHFQDSQREHLPLLTKTALSTDPPCTKRHILAQTKNTVTQAINEGASISSLCSGDEGVTENLEKILDKQRKKCNCVLRL